MYTCGQCGTTCSDNTFHSCQPAQTIDKRTLLAGMAMHGILINLSSVEDVDAHGLSSDGVRAELAKASVKFADALLLELSKPTAKETT